MDTTNNNSEIRDTEGSLDGAWFDGYFFEKADDGKATRVTSPNGAVYVFAHPSGDVIRHEGPADEYPPHIADLVMAIVRPGYGPDRPA